MQNDLHSAGSSSLPTIDQIAVVEALNAKRLLECEEYAIDLRTVTPLHRYSVTGV